MTPWSEDPVRVSLSVQVTPPTWPSAISMEGRWGVHELPGSQGWHRGEDEAVANGNEPQPGLWVSGGWDCFSSLIFVLLEPGVSYSAFPGPWARGLPRPLGALWEP